MHRKEENSLFSILYSLFSILSPSYRRESKAYRRGTKSAINYVHLLRLIGLNQSIQPSHRNYLWLKQKMS